jgi:hypothetical protein
MLDVGLYVNLFEAEFEDIEAKFHTVSRSEYPDMRALRAQIEQEGSLVSVYASGDVIYGYGPDQETLKPYGFHEERLRFLEIPQLTSRMILEGFANSLERADYKCRYSYGRVIAYRYDVPLLEEPIKLFIGFELQSIFLMNPEDFNLMYGLIIKPIFAYRDKQGKSISPSEINHRFGSQTLRLVREKQGDLVSTGGINLEVSRRQLTKYILPFVEARHEFELPVGIPARLKQEPVRIILSIEKQT